METPDCISLKPLFKDEQEFLKLIEDDPKLTEYYLKEVVKIYRSTFLDEYRLIEYFKKKTGIKDVYNLSILETMRLSAFLTLVRHCPDVRRFLPDFKRITQKSHRRQKVSIELSKK